jgi:hypothetical protein
MNPTFFSIAALLSVSGAAHAQALCDQIAASCETMSTAAASACYETAAACYGGQLDSSGGADGEPLSDEELEQVQEESNKVYCDTLQSLNALSESSGVGGTIALPEYCQESGYAPEPEQREEERPQRRTSRDPEIITMLQETYSVVELFEAGGVVPDDLAGAIRACYDGARPVCDDLYEAFDGICALDPSSMNEMFDRRTAIVTVNTSCDVADILYGMLNN